MVWKTQRHNERYHKGDHWNW